MILIKFVTVVFAFTEVAKFQSLLQSAAATKTLRRAGALRSVHTIKRWNKRFNVVFSPPNENTNLTNGTGNTMKDQKSVAGNTEMYSNENNDNKLVAADGAMSKVNIEEHKVNNNILDTLSDNKTIYVNEHILSNKTIYVNEHILSNKTIYVNEHILSNKTLVLEKYISSDMNHNDQFINNIRITDNSVNENKSTRRQRRRAQHYSRTSKNTKPLGPHSSAVYKAPNSLYHQPNIRRQRTCACESTKCDLQVCHLTSVPQDLPRNIVDLNLATNDIQTLTANSFLRYGCLEHLVLSYNNISVIEDGAFNGLSRLRVLDLSNNLIGDNANLSEHIFVPLKSLKVLRLNDNMDSTCSSARRLDLMLAYLDNLTELYIYNYGNQEYGPGFRNMTSLRNLTFSCECSIDQLTNTSFINLGQITLLNISNCDIQGAFIDNGALAPLTNLRTLDISMNTYIGTEYLPAILWGLKRSNLQTLIMDKVVSDYSINFISSSITQILPDNLTTLSARDNNILSIDNEGIKSLPKGLNLIDVSGNYMIVDPEDIALNRMEGLEVLLINSNSDECYPKSNGRRGPLALEDFNFYQSEPTTDQDAHKTGIDTLSQRMGARIPWKLRLVQVSLKSVPNDFLRSIDENNNLEQLDLRCSFIPELDFYSFKSLTRLRYLNAGSSSVEQLILFGIPTVSPITVLILESNKLNNFLNTITAPFDGLNNLVHLDISLNYINNLDPDLFYGLNKLQNLLLQGNTFSRFSANISHIKSLKILDVRNTGLSNLPDHVRTHINHLYMVTRVQITVRMSGCPIQCDCFNLDFLKWMVNSPAFKNNFTGYKCRYSDTSIKEITDQYTATIRDLERECAQNYPMFLVILAATMIIFCAVMGAIIYRFRWKIRYLYYAAYLKVMDTHKKDNKDAFMYDVFVSYDSEDQGFVSRCLSPELEKRDLKLLIHTRDFMAGTFIASNIVMAVAESRKTLVVLTRNLMESTWCNFEIQMATMEAVHTGRPVLVFLLKENIPNRELDVELLRYIKSNTYLPYPGPEEEGDEEIMKKFYDKLAHDLKW
ncbi:hypothetical protein BsWGS_03829 [Bradybaena similaris]